MEYIAAIKLLAAIKPQIVEPVRIEAYAQDDFGRFYKDLSMPLCCGSFSLVSISSVDETVVDAEEIRASLQVL
jgi:hypothetical protein